jgi:tetratricopeptide (TPR) repeat protein
VLSKPRIFLSAVSSEFKSLRIDIEHLLKKLGFDVESQDIFGTEAGDLRQLLRSKIDPCKAVVHLVGVAYGAEPPAPDESFGRVSYTQFEFYYARSRGIPCHVFLIGEDNTQSRDRPIDQLDLPPKPGHPDPTGHQHIRRLLQQAYRDQLEIGPDIYHPASTRDGVLLKVHELDSKLEQIRKEHAEASRKLLQGLDDIKTQLTEGQKITRDRIRGHLLDASEKRLADDLVAAQALPDWKQRAARMSLARAEHDQRLTRIDALAQEFAEIEGSAHATDVLRELTRVLAEQGVDEAIEFVEARRPDILTRVRRRTDQARQQNRADLAPLLRAASLESGRGAHDRAATLLDDILRVEPDWPDALHQRFWVVINLADRARVTTTLGRTLDLLRTAEASARRLTTLYPTNTEWQRDLSVSHNKIGGVERALGRLEPALASYQAGMKIAEGLATLDPTNTEWQRDLSISHNKIGGVEQALGRLEPALASYRADMTICQHLAGLDPTNAEWQRDVWVSACKIADVMQAVSNVEARTYWVMARDQLRRMRDRGVFVSDKDLGFLRLLEELDLG